MALPISTMQQKHAQNMAKPCSHAGCTNYRYNQYSYCLKHSTALKRYGHPEGRPISPIEYASLEARLLKVCENPSLAPLVSIKLDSALSTMSQRLDKGPSSKHELVNKVLESGLTAPRLLARLGAILYFAADNPDKLPKDMRLNHAVVRGIIGLMPKEKKVGRNGSIFIKPNPVATVSRAYGGYIQALMGIVEVDRLQAKALCA